MIGSNTNADLNNSVNSNNNLFIKSIKSPNGGVNFH